MEELRFDERVAVVTGAGRGLGAAYAQLLAQRGAIVVVNDLGGTTEGDGSDPQPALKVVAEIEGAGGTAIPDFNDVSTVEGGAAVIETAIDAFGRIDVLVNNAGNIRWGVFPEAKSEDLNSLLAVHVGGSFNTSRAAWPHMLERGYGRIVMTTSSGIFGEPGALGYPTAKAAVIGMMQSLKIAGAPHGILANAISPCAITRMAGHDTVKELEPVDAATTMSPGLVAPMVAVLAHESCDSSGGIYLAGGSRFARIFIGVTTGCVPTMSRRATPEDIVDNWRAINDESGYYVPSDLQDWWAHFQVETL
jgi:NAD(P)-dependent dehydrogenase (short-subunit alcohol dehydrogenase family)